MICGDSIRQELMSFVSDKLADKYKQLGERRAEQISSEFYKDEEALEWSARKIDEIETDIAHYRELALAITEEEEESRNRAEALRRGEG